MANQAQHQNHAAAGHAHEGPTVRRYIEIFVALFIATGVEVAITFLEGIVPTWMIVSMLLLIMAVKGVMVVSFYMHLRFDSRWFTFLFASAIGIALFNVIGFILIFWYRAGLE